MPDCRGMHGDPYRASQSDWKEPDEKRSDGITVVPMSAGFVPREWYPEGRLAPFKRAVKRLLRIREETEYAQTLNLSCPQRFICHILDGILSSRPNPLLACALRTNTPTPAWQANVEAIFDHLMRHHRRREIILSTPEEAVAQWRANGGGSVSPLTGR
jgi:hypothetical protein